MDALSAYLGFGLGLLAPGDTGGDEKESKSTKLYLPERTLRASSLSSKAAPTLDLYASTLSVFLQDGPYQVAMHALPGDRCH